MPIRLANRDGGTTRFRDDPTYAIILASEKSLTSEEIIVMSANTRFERDLDLLLQSGQRLLNAIQYECHRNSFKGQVEETLGPDDCFYLSDDSLLNRDCPWKPLLQGAPEFVEGRILAAGGIDCSGQFGEPAGGPLHASMLHRFPHRFLWI